MIRLSPEKVLIGLIFISLALKFFLIPFNQGMWWDEAVYLGLGRSISQGFYALEAGTTLETFRPPLFPFLITMIRESVIAVRIFVALTSVLAVFSVYLLGREYFNRRIGLLSALLTGTSFYFVFFSIKALSEPLLIAMISFSMIYFHRWIKEDNTKNICLSGIFMALALLTRYFAVLLFFSYLAYFIYMKRFDRRPLQFFAAAGLVMLPWFIMNQLSYGNPIGAVFSNLGFYSEEIVYPLQRTLQEVAIALGPAIIALPLGFFMLSKKFRRNSQLLFFVALSLGFFALLHHREPRYLLSFYPAYAIVSGYALNKIHKHDFTRLALPAVLVTLMVIMSWSLQVAWVDRVAASGLINGTIGLKEFVQPGETVLAQSYPYVYYFSEAKARKFPVLEEEMGNTVRNNSITYILYHKFEDGNPGYVHEYFRQFEVVKKFEEWNDPDAVIIYKINDEFR
jgi:4-amino-4-deoxy-L-arabinose transferase-like glycosyltransferase